MKQLAPIILILLLCQACIQLGSDSLPTRYYLLEPVAESVTDEHPPVLKINLGPIDFPSYLDRRQIISRSSNNAVIAATNDRWAEPLPENFQRVLQENLYRQLGNAEIQIAPWSSSVRPDYQIILTINRFDAVLGKNTNVDIRWEILSLQDKNKHLKGHFQQQLAIDDSFNQMTQKLSQALSSLSAELVNKLWKQKGYSSSL